MHGFLPLRYFTILFAGTNLPLFYQRTAVDTTRVAAGGNTRDTTSASPSNYREAILTYARTLAALDQWPVAAGVAQAARYRPNSRSTSQPSRPPAASGRTEAEARDGAGRPATR